MVSLAVAYSKNFARFVHAASLVLYVTLLCSCSSSSDPQPEEATEIPLSKKPAVEGASEELFQNAKRLYSSALFSVARETFDSLRVQQPLGAYAEYAAIKAADCSFEAGTYEEAAVAYEEISKNHPASRSSPYVLLQAGRSYLLANRGVGRDASPLEKARTFFEQVVRDYPDSRYYFPALELRHQVVGLLAQQEKEIMDFYEKKSVESAYQARAQVYKEKWAPLLGESGAQLAQASPRAPLILAAEKHSISEVTAPSLLSVERSVGAARQNDSGKDNSENSTTELASPEIDPGSEAPRMMAKLSSSALAEAVVPAPSALKASARDLGAKALARQRYVAQARCSAGILMVETSSGLSPDELSALKLALTQTGKSGTALRLQLPLTAAAESDFRCFGQAEVSISKAGELTILQAPKLKVLQLQKPPRLLFAERRS